jgi:hypothetical protein
MIHRAALSRARQLFDNQSQDIDLHRARTAATLPDRPAIPRNGCVEKPVAKQGMAVARWVFKVQSWSKMSPNRVKWVSFLTKPLENKHYLASFGRLLFHGTAVWPLDSSFFN